MHWISPKALGAAQSAALKDLETKHNPTQVNMDDEKNNTDDDLIVSV